MPKHTYMIPVETKTLAVYAIEADRPLDAAIEYGRRDQEGTLDEVCTSSHLLSVKIGQPQVAVPLDPQGVGLVGNLGKPRPIQGATE